MTRRPYGILLTRILYWWEENLLRWPWVVIFVFILLSGLTLRYTLNHLKVNTNTAEMISTEVPFQKNRIRLEAEFPQDINTIILLVEGKSPEQTAEAVTRLGQTLRGDTAHFRSVYIPDEGEFLERNGLLYLSLEELEQLSSRMASAQPFVGRLSTDYSLRGLLGILTDALEAPADASDSIELEPLLTRISDGLNATRAGKPQLLSWQELLSPHAQGLGVTQRFLLIKPLLNYSDLTPAESVITALDGIIAGIRRRCSRAAGLSHAQPTLSQPGAGRDRYHLSCARSAQPSGRQLGQPGPLRRSALAAHDPFHHADGTLRRDRALPTARPLAGYWRGDHC